MPIFNIKGIRWPENHVVIEMTYEQFRKYLEDQWDETLIFRTPDGKLYAFQDSRDVIFVGDAEETAKS